MENLEKDKLDLINWITTLNDISSIERIKFIRDNKSKQPFWDELSEEERNAVEKGIEDIESGKVTPHDEVRKVYEKWL